MSIINITSLTSYVCVGEGQIVFYNFNSPVRCREFLFQYS